MDRLVEMKLAVARWSICLAKRLEQRTLDSQDINKAASSVQPLPPATDTDPTAVESAADSTPLHMHVESSIDLTKVLHRAYHRNTILLKIMWYPDAHPNFGIRDGLIWTKNQFCRDIVCVPCESFLIGRRVLGVIIDLAHKTVGHYSPLKMSTYVWCTYWWPKMATDIEPFCISCGKCQMNKSDNSKPSGLLAYWYSLSYTIIIVSEYI